MKKHNEALLNNESLSLYDPVTKITTILRVYQIGLNTYSLIDNDIFNYKLTRGTEIKTRINIEGNHEILDIVKLSSLITKRYILNSQFKESEYRVIGDELIKHGGYWQIDFGKIATINLPSDCKINIKEIFLTFDFNPEEMEGDSHLPIIK